MAMSSMSQSTVAYSLPRGKLIRQSTDLSFSSVVPPQKHVSRPMQMRCQINVREDLPEKNPSASEASTEVTQTPLPLSPPKVSTKFGDILAFGGPAPERINGRLAMIGFTAAMAVELSSGNDVLTQISNGGLPWFLGTTAVLSLASLIPLFKGVSTQSKSSGLMTSDAEMWNGRFAMLGLVALIFTEYLKGGALI